MTTHCFFQQTDLNLTVDDFLVSGQTTNMEWGFLFCTPPPLSLISQ
jgi:hypothetical protein